MLMPGKKVVLIHQIMDSLTNLEDTIERYRPDYVFLLSCQYYARDKPSMAIMEIEEMNDRTLGENVNHIQYHELVIIENAWHESTMMEVYVKLGDIKRKSQELAGDDQCVFYAGLSDGPALMTVGVSFAAILYGMKTYFTRGRRPYYNRNYVLDIDNLNRITETKNWLDSHYTAKKNLRYLKVAIRLEEEGESEITSGMIAERLPSITKKAVDNAIRILSDRGLIEVEGKRNRTLKSTDLGKLTIEMFSDVANS